MVRPRVEYAFSVWSAYTKQTISKAEMIQWRAARWVKTTILRIKVSPECLMTWDGHC